MRRTRMNTASPRYSDFFGVSPCRAALRTYKQEVAASSPHCPPFNSSTLHQRADRRSEHWDRGPPGCHQFCHHFGSSSSLREQVRPGDQTRILRCSRAARTLAGKSATSIIGMPHPVDFERGDFSTTQADCKSLETSTTRLPSCLLPAACTVKHPADPVCSQNAYGGLCYIVAAAFHCDDRNDREKNKE